MKTIAEIEAAALVLSLNPEKDGQAICAGLISGSPHVDKIYDKIYVTERFWQHILTHEDPEVTKRLKRLNWLLPCLQTPCEIWEPDPPTGTRYYITCVKHYVEQNKEWREFVVIIVKNTELQNKLSVDTMYMLRSSQIAKFRAGRRIWP